MDAQNFRRWGDEDLGVSIGTPTITADDDSGGTPRPPTPPTPPGPPGPPQVPGGWRRP